MIYLLSWTSKDPAASIHRFLQSPKLLEETSSPITLHLSLHVQNEPRGFVVLEANEPEAVHKAVEKWNDVLDIEVTPCWTDEEAKKALPSILEQVKHA